MRKYRVYYTVNYRIGGACQESTTVVARNRKEASKKFYQSKCAYEVKAVRAESEKKAYPGKWEDVS